MRRFTLLMILLLTIPAVALAGCTSTAAPTPTPTSEATPTPTATVEAVVATPIPSLPAPVAGLPDVASVVEQVLPAVVQILATVEETNLFGQVVQNTVQGSGIMFDESGYVLTNNHVVEDTIEIEVALFNHQIVPAEIVGTDPSTDIAVLKIDPELVEDFITVALGDTDAMRPGEWVIAIGSPLGYESSVTVGVVSGTGRSLDLGDDIILNDLVQTDAVINPGNSGGPLLNMRGEVIGINTAIIRGETSGGQQADGIGFAISMGTAIPVAGQLIEKGHVVRPRMGVIVQDVTPASVTERDLGVVEGILIVSLAEDGPAERAGIEIDDVIVRIDGAPVTTTSALVRKLLTEYHVGDVVHVTIVRGAVHLEFEVTLEEIP